MSTLKVNTLRHSTASSDAITMATDGTCTVKATNNLSNRNLVINGAMVVAQRGTTATTNGYGTVDMNRVGYAGQDNVITQSQITLTSSDAGPWAKGFTKALQVTNGNQSNGADSDDSCTIQYKMEGQDLANSGWDFTNPNSKLTTSFWAKSSVAQTYYGRFRLYASSQYEYTYSIALSANTWTKVTHTIPGNSNFSGLVNTNAVGFIHNIQLYYGADFTNNKALNTWAVKDNANYSPDMDSTWWTTNSATFAMTGLQIEVGDVATEFEHRLYADELNRCQRYFVMIASGADDATATIALAMNYSASNVRAIIHFPTTMRTIPDYYDVTGTNYWLFKLKGDTDKKPDSIAGGNERLNSAELSFTDDIGSLDAGEVSLFRINHANARLGYTAEL